MFEVAALLAFGLRLAPGQGKIHYNKYLKITVSETMLTYMTTARITGKIYIKHASKLPCRHINIVL